MSRVENWAIIYDELDPYKAPEQRVARLTGNLYGDHRCAEGEKVTTSRITSIDMREKIIKTKNTTYKLGKIDDSFYKFIQDNNFKLEDYNGSVVQ